MLNKIRVFFAHLFYLWQRLPAGRCDGGEGPAVTVETDTTPQCEFWNGSNRAQCAELGTIHFVGMRLCRQHASMKWEDERLAVKVTYWRERTEAYQRWLQKEMDINTSFAGALREAQERKSDDTEV